MPIDVANYSIHVAGTIEDSITTSCLSWSARGIPMLSVA